MCLFHAENGSAITALLQGEALWKEIVFVFFRLPSHVLECQIDGCCLIIMRVQGGLGGKSNMPLMPTVRGKARAEGLAGSPTLVLISD